MQMVAMVVAALVCVMQVTVMELLLVVLVITMANWIMVTGDWWLCRGCRRWWWR